MAEALGFAASIIAAIQLTAAVTSLSYGYISGVKKASDDLRDLVDELSALGKVLNTLQNYANTSSESTLQKLNQNDGPLRLCRLELKNLELKLEPPEGFRGMMSSLKWPLKEKETLQQLSRIERLKNIFILALNADHMFLSRSIETCVRELQTELQYTNISLQSLDVEAATRKQDDDTLRVTEKRKAVLRWLFPQDFDKKHIEISGKRQHRTGEWILKSPEFLEWIKRGTSSRILWGHGIPGAGKTFLTSSVIDYFQDQAPTKRYGVAYIYFDYNEQIKQGPLYVITSLSKQLASQIPVLPKEIEDLYDRLDSIQKTLDLEQSYTVLLLALNSFAQTFVIFDALDECNQRSQRNLILPLCRRMEEDGIHLFLTSRPHPEDIRDYLKKSANISLYAHKEDIKNFIEAKINESPRARRFIGQGEFRNKVISDLTDCAKGMFLLIHFHIEYLCGQTTKRQILIELERLKNFSTEERPLDPTYDRILESIYMRPKSCFLLAKDIFTWLVKARRALTVQEIQIAISLQPNAYELDELQIPERETLIDVCAGLVTIDQNSNTIRLIHYTVQEYLNRNPIIPEKANLKLLMTCTTFLSSGILQSSTTRLLGYSFLDYAAQYFYSHLQDCDECLSTELVLKFISNPRNISVYIEGLKPPDYWFYKSPNSQLPLLHLASALGHKAAIRTLLQGGADISEQDNEGYTAMHVAALGGNLSVVRLLLESGANILQVSFEGSTALHYALGFEGKCQRCIWIAKSLDISPQARTAISVVLIENGANISAVNRSGFVALHLAAKVGSELVVQMLLDRGANISAANETGETAMHLAAEAGHRKIVQLLLEKGADISLKDQTGFTALHRATISGCEAILLLLLQRGADISAASGSGYTALHLGAKLGHEKIVYLLLDKGADISAANRDGFTALHQATEGGHETIVKLLLDKGADTSATNKSGFTALHQAVGKGYETVVELLLEKGVDISAVSKDGSTALHLAAEGWNKIIVKLLLDKGADPLIKKEDGNTALHVAVISGRKTIVQLLLEKSANISAINKNGETALHLAAMVGSKAMIKLLLDRGADTSATNKGGYTVLHLAASRLGRVVVQLLLDKGADISATSSDGDTALHLAAGVSVGAMVQLLLDRGADILATNRDGCTALHIATREGNATVLQLLILYGADMSIKNRFGFTALDLATDPATKSAMLDYTGVV